MNTAAWWLEAHVGRSTLQRLWRRVDIRQENFIALCRAVGIENWQQIAEPTTADISDLPRDIRFWGWERAPDLEHFFGREAELQQLRQWIEVDRCKLITILGMGGIGKTSLVVALADQLQADQNPNRFDSFLWYSLQDAPPLAVFLADIEPFLTERLAPASLPPTPDPTANLLNYLQHHRCLLVMDNAESILAGQDSTGAGQYRSGYETYERLFQQIGTNQHQSCLLITSREQPRGLTRLADSRVRCLRLEGLPIEAGYQVLQNFAWPSHQAWQAIVSHYGGNPLALRIVAAGIRDILQGDIGYFLDRLHQGYYPFSDLQDLLERHLERLTDLERELLLWLAIAREPITLRELDDCLLSALARQDLPTTIESLRRRCLLGEADAGYTLQPVVMEHLTRQLIRAICDELASQGGAPQGQQSYLHTYALMQATAKDYVRDTQIRLIVRPILERSRPLLIPSLQPILENLRQGSDSPPGYGAGNLINLLIQMGANLANYDFSRLTIRQAYLRGVELHGVNFTEARFHQVVFSETMGKILNLAFHPDGCTLATVDDRGWLYLWDLTADRQILATRVHLEWVFALAFSPDGSLIATAGLDRVINLWRWNEGCLALGRSLTGHQIGISALAFSPDGTILASASADRTVKLWQVQTGELQRTLEGHTAIVRAVTFSQEGQWVISGSWDHTLRVWDWQTGECLRTLRGHTDAVETIALVSLPQVPQGLISGSYDRTLKLWNLETGNCVQTFSGHHDRIYTVACTTLACNINPGEEPQVLIASAGDDHTLRLWDAESGEVLQTLPVVHQRIWTLAFDPSGTSLASGSHGGLLQLWDVQTGRCWRTIHGYENLTSPFGFNADNTILYTFSYRNRQLRHWDCQTAQCLRAIPLEVGMGAMEVRLSPDRQWVAIAGLDHTIRLFSIHDGTCQRTFQGHQGWVRALAFSPTQRQFASGSGDGTIQIWDLETGHGQQILADHTGPVQCVAFSPEGTLLASGSWDNTIKLWNPETGALLDTLPGHNDRVEDVVFSQDGRTLFSCSLDDTLKTWSIETRRCIGSQPGEGEGLSSLSLSSDGQWLAKATYNGNVQVHHLSHHQSVTIAGGVIYGSVVFASDSRTLAVRAAQGNCQLWDVPTGELLRTFQIDRLYEGLNLTQTTGLTVAQQETLRALGAVVG